MYRIKYVTIALLLFTVHASTQNWQTNLEEAKLLASEENKIIVLVFQGSDWCAPCIKLEKEIWTTNEFKDIAKDKFVMLKADFPRRKKNKLSEEQQKHNNKLAEKYNTKGYFPYVVVLDKNGEELGSLGYEKITPKAYSNKILAFEK